MEKQKEEKQYSTNVKGSQISCFFLTVLNQDTDTQIQDQIDEMLSSLQGSDTETVSFVSEKNTNISSVQFVIKTDKIEKPVIEETETQTTQKVSFWQKLLNLFM